LRCAAASNVARDPERRRQIIAQVVMPPQLISASLAVRREVGRPHFRWHSPCASRLKFHIPRLAVGADFRLGPSRRNLVERGRRFLIFLVEILEHGTANVGLTMRRGEGANPVMFWRTLSSRAIK